MRSILALLRSAWLDAMSYRVATLLSLVGVLASVIPIYFISGAVQDLAAESISREGGQYFGFIIVGLAAVYLLAAAVAAIPGAIAGGIGSGTFEALLVTRTSLPMLLVGLGAWPVVQSVLRALVLLAGAAVLGVEFRWMMFPAAAGILLVMVVAYGSIGLIAAALVLAFRTSGPLISGVVALSGLLGGAYYATAAVPGWLHALTDFVPLTYALRPVRMLVLGDAPLADVAPDVSLLALIASGLLLVGSSAFALALRRARRAGSLSQY
jgi:ABC-2 type transport system permease protein